MNRFMIGQYGFFDTKKQHRDFKENFYGVEACLFKDKEDILELKKVANDGDFNIAVHFPLRSGIAKLRDPQYLSKDVHTLKTAYETIKDEILFMKEINLSPKYILFHYPKPVVLDEAIDSSLWRFPDESEYYYETEIEFEEFERKSENFFNWISKQGFEHDFIPVLEFDFLNKYTYSTNMLEKLLKKYCNVKLCLDIGRLHAQNMTDKNFSSFDVVRKYSKYAEVIHLSNIKVITKLECNHYPALKKLNPNEGWADVEKYLNIIKHKNENCKILFEHRSDLITDEELEECYDWVNSILND